MVQLGPLKDRNFPDIILLPGRVQLVTRVFALDQEQPVRRQFRMDDDRLEILKVY
jgi:hypothetical protein